MTNIAVLVGSLRQDSWNKRLARALERLAPEGTVFHYIDIAMPLFNQDREAEYPVEAQQARDIITESDGVLIVTPEYNRSVPGVLKNAIDWISRPGGRGALKDKPLGIVGATDGPIGTAMAQYDLKRIMMRIGSDVMTRPEVYFTPAPELVDETGNVADERWRGTLAAYMKALVDYIDAAGA